MVEETQEIVSAAETRRGIADRGRAYISEATGFDGGDLFESEEAVREYFTVDTLRDWLDGCPYTQEALDAMAEAVIDGRWHMATACLVCDHAGQYTAATETVEVRCPECGETRTQDLCAECAAQARQAPPEALWCEDCHRHAAMGRA